MISKYIKSLGLELEGGIYASDLYVFERKMRNKIADFEHYYKVGSDGSVDVECPDGDDQVCDDWISNIEIRFWHYNVNVLMDFVRELWYRGFVQNDTCGNHMHIRFINLIYASIFTDVKAHLMYLDEYKKRFGNNTKYMDRLENNYSRACLNQECVDDNVLKSLGSRYRMINLRSIIDKGYKTLEVRVMPYAESAEELIDMMMFNIRTIDMIIERYTINGNIVLKVLDLRDIKRLMNHNGKKKKIMIKEVY